MILHLCWFKDYDDISMSCSNKCADSNRQLFLTVLFICQWNLVEIVWNLGWQQELFEMYILMKQWPNFKIILMEKSTEKNSKMSKLMWLK